MRQALEVVRLLSWFLPLLHPNQRDSIRFLQDGFERGLGLTLKWLVYFICELRLFEPCAEAPAEFLRESTGDSVFENGLWRSFLPLFCPAGFATPPRVNLGSRSLRDLF